MQTLMRRSPLTIAVVDDSHRALPAELPEYIRVLVDSEDTVLAMKSAALSLPEACDLVLLVGCHYASELIPKLAKAKVPVLLVEPFHGFHVYHSTTLRVGERRGVQFLPHFTPAELRASIAAVRSRKMLRDKKLLTVRTQSDAMRNELHHGMVRTMKKRAGVEIISAKVEELRERAKHFNARAVRTELTRWREDLLEPDIEMPAHHQEEVVRLYLAERLLLDETGAIGITVDDIHGFLLSGGHTMPNATYGILAEDGYLACEEADTGALATQLLLWAAMGKRSSMSNLYFGYRQALTACASFRDYDEAKQQSDLLQCFLDNRITASHFSTAGVIPPEMRREKRQRWVETLPSWPKQSMLAANPKLGPVLLARISLDGHSVHLTPGEIDGYGHGEQYEWYRGRYFIKLPNARAFAEQMEHQHYAIGHADELGTQTLRILLSQLLGFELTG